MILYCICLFESLFHFEFLYDLHVVLHFQKSFDFGPSLLDEMDAVFRSFGDSPVPPAPPSPGLPPLPASPLDETVNVRNELREMAAKVTGKKKQATVS